MVCDGQWLAVHIFLGPPRELLKLAAGRLAPRLTSEVDNVWLPDQNLLADLLQTLVAQHQDLCNQGQSIQYTLSRAANSFIQKYKLIARGVYLEMRHW